MTIKRIGAKVPADRLRSWLGGCCAFAVLVLLVVAGIGLSRVYAQSNPQAHPADAQASSVGPADAQSPATGNAAAKNASPDAAASVPPPAGNLSPEDRRRQEITAQCANLLKMATDLKSEVDKTTKDELSVSVVRKADEIEQFARKVRGDTRLTAGKE